MSGKTKKCNTIYKWHLQRITRKHKESKNPGEKQMNKFELDGLKTKEGKMRFIKSCLGPEAEIYSNIQNENDYNKKMDKFDELTKKFMNQMNFEKINKKNPKKINMNNYTRKVKKIFLNK
jgi:hypothetical protein